MSILAMGVVFGFLLMGAAAALIVTFYPDAVPALRRTNRAVMAVDALAALLAATGLGLALHQFQGILLDRFHAQAVLSIGSPDIVASAAPALAAVASAVRALLTDAALIGLLALLAGTDYQALDAVRGRAPGPVRDAPRRSPHARRVPAALHDLARHGRRRLSPSAASSPAATTWRTPCCSG